MPPSPAAILPGTLEVLILRALATGERHGLGIARRIEAMTRGAFEVKAGSLFPALHRMEQAGWLCAEWGDSENNRRAKFYRLTAAGRRQLKDETNQWARISAAMAGALGTP